MGALTITYEDDVTHCTFTAVRKDGKNVWEYDVHDAQGELLRSGKQIIALWPDEKTVYRKLITASFTVIEAATTAIKFARSSAAWAARRKP